MLKSLHVQHYKSLSDIHIDFGPITLLVGPNGAGKSNVVDALRFLRDAIVHGLDHAVSDRGGIDVLRQYSPTKPHIVNIRAEFVDEETGRDFSYGLRLISARGDFAVQAEEAQWYSIEPSDDNESDEEMIEPHDIKRHVDNSVELDGDSLPDVVSNNTLAIVTLRETRHLLHHFVGLRFSHLFPNILREPARPDAEKRLKENCGNWASIIKSMRQTKSGERVLHKVMDAMRQIWPGLQTVTVKGIGGYLVPQFLVQDEQGGKSHYFDPVQLSDGTLRLFGMLLALYQVPSPRLLAMEEPEQTVHPGVLGILVDAFREVSASTQLLLTTHSPHLLDYFDTDEMRVVHMQAGETKVSRVKATQVEAVRRGLMRISEIAALDGIRPEIPFEQFMDEAFWPEDGFHQPGTADTPGYKR